MERYTSKRTRARARVFSEKKTRLRQATSYRSALISKVKYRRLDSSKYHKYSYMSRGVRWKPQIKMDKNKMHRRTHARCVLARDYPI